MGLTVRHLAEIILCQSRHDGGNGDRRRGERRGGCIEEGVEWVYGSSSPVVSTRSPFTPFPRSGYITIY